MLRAIGSLDGTLVPEWNLSAYNAFDVKRGSHIWHCKRRDSIRRTIMLNMKCKPNGRGSKAWKRWEAMLREPGTLVWPDYAM